MRAWLIVIVSLVCIAAQSADGDAPKKPGAEEYTYEGRTAAQWAEELRAGNHEKATRALTRLGKDALPTLMSLARDKDPGIADQALKIMASMKRDNETIKGLIEMLKDPSWETRRTAARALGAVAADDPAAAQALKDALQDKDKAVAEAAEEALKPVQHRAEQRRDGLATAKKVFDAGRINEALELLKAQLKENPDDVEVQQMLGTVAKAAAERQEWVKKEEQRLMADKEIELRRNEKQMILQVLIKNASKALENGDPNRAQELCLKAMAIEPANEQVLALSGRIKGALRATEDKGAKKVEKETEKKENEF